MYSIKTTPAFDRDIKRLNKQVVKRIIAKIEFLAKNPKLMRYSLKYLPKDLEGLQKYRIGNHRVLFWVDDVKKEMVLYGVEHRREIYKRFRK